MSRVLLVTNDFPPRPGGIQSYLEELVRRLAAAGEHEVTVYAPRWKGAEEFDRAAAEFVADVRRTDPGAETVEPPAPWDNRPDPAPAYERFQMVHAIEELARHAGHADIIREQIDGAQAMSLHFAAAGMPGNQFVQPWRPADA